MFKRLNQKGFAGIETILIAVVLIIAGGTGYYIYNANKNTNKTLDNAAKSAQSSPEAKNKSSASSSGAQYVTIKEWGVRAPYSGKLHLSYTIKQDTGTITYAAFTSSELNAQGSQCAEEKNFGGSIERYTATDEMLNQAGDTTGQTAADYAATLDKNQYAHVGKYYYFYSSPQAVCDDSQSGQAVQAETTQAVKDLLPKLVSNS